MHKQFIRQLEGRKTDTGASEVILPVTNLNKRYQDSGIYIYVVHKMILQTDLGTKYKGDLVLLSVKASFLLLIFCFYSYFDYNRMLTDVPLFFGTFP